MKATGMVRKLDELGRITLPIEIRKNYGIENGTPVEIFTDDDAIVIKKFQSREPHCHRCNSDKQLHDFGGGVFICDNCMIAKLAED